MQKSESVRSQADDPYFMTFQTAYALHQEAKLSEARDLYLEILHKKPDHFDALNLLGVISFQSGKPAEAVAFYIDAIQINDNFAPVYSNLGNALKNLKLFDQALMSYDKAIEINSYYAEALYNRGVVLHELSRFHEALHSFEKSITIKPDSWEAFLSRGNALHNLDRYHEALRNYEIAIYIKSDSANSFYNRGVTFQSLARFDEALTAYNTAISIQSDYAEAFNNRGNVFKELKRFNEALASYAKALSIEPDYPDALYNQSVMLQMLDNFDDALQSYERLILIKPDYAEAFNNRGVLFQKLKAFEKALIDYEKAGLIKPDYADAHYNRGVTLQELNRFEDSLQSYERAILADPDHAEAFNNRGTALHSLKQFDEALASYNKAISIKSDYAEAFYNRGGTLQELKQFNTAMASFEKAISINSDYAIARYAKALNLLQQGYFSSGWLEYEYRLKNESFILNSLGDGARFLSKLVPVMSASDLIGKHLILIGEQGVGDVVMFASVIRETMHIVKRIDLLVDPRLVNLLKRSFPSLRVFCLADYDSNSLPEDAMFLFIGSLGRLFRNNVGDFPKAAYLVPDFEQVVSWRKRLQCADKKIIGISWKGGTPSTRDWARSFPLQRFLKFLPTRDVRFVNIQHESSIQEVRDTVDNCNIEILTFAEAETYEISDLSALLCALDLVVTVQNSNIHLCGGLGVPCVGIIPSVPEWRYGLNSEDMLWYGSVKLVRMQAGIGNQEVNQLIDYYINQLGG